MASEIINTFKGEEIYLLTPVVYSDGFCLKMQWKGFLEIRFDGCLVDLVSDVFYNKWHPETTEIVLEKLKVKDSDFIRTRIERSLTEGFDIGDGQVYIDIYEKAVSRSNSLKVGHFSYRFTDSSLDVSEVSISRSKLDDGSTPFGLGYQQDPTVSEENEKENMYESPDVNVDVSICRWCGDQCTSVVLGEGLIKNSHGS